jgi:inorganic pyrophosphatase
MSAAKLTPGPLSPEELNVFIEIAQGSSVKYELDKESGLLKVDRFIHSAMVYPFNYGFVPGTMTDDGDPLDVAVLSAQPVIPGSILPARPIGLLDMEDESGMDIKIIAVPTKAVDPWYAEIEDIENLDKHTLSEIKHFFSHYKELESGKWVKIRHFGGREEALEAIRKSILS